MQASLPTFVHLRLHYKDVSVEQTKQIEVWTFITRNTSDSQALSSKTEAAAGMKKPQLVAAVPPTVMLSLQWLLLILVQAASSSAYPAHGRWYAASTWLPMGVELEVINGAGFGGNPVEARWQSDCNLVLYRNDKSYWSTDTAKFQNHICYLAVQRDGNLVVYGDHEQPLWASNSGNHEDAEYYVQIQLDGNLVIYTPDDAPIWASQTNYW